MKYFYSFALLLVFHATLPGQDAGEILLKTQNAYRSLDNIILEGQMSLVTSHIDSYEDMRLITNKSDRASYFLAMNKEGNISHWYKTDGTSSISSYYKSRGDSLGLYTRPGTKETFECSPILASARLGATGGAVMYYFGSMFYDQFNSSSKTDSSFILFYDEVKLLPDTIIANQPCYVVKTNKVSNITQEMADKLNYRRDSLAHVLDLPLEQRGGSRAEAGSKYFSNVYCIRKTDHMIISSDFITYSSDGETVKSKRNLSLSPRYNLSDFESYLIP